MEPALEGTLPSARKGVAAASSGQAFVVMFGGCATSEEGQDVYLGDLFLLEVTSLGGSGGVAGVRCAQQETAGPAPPARAGALLQEMSDGRMLLYGGTGAGGKALGDAWLLDVATLTWECLYDGTPEAAGLPVSSTGCAGLRIQPLRSCA